MTRSFPDAHRISGGRFLFSLLALPRFCLYNIPMLISPTHKDFDTYYADLASYDAHWVENKDLPFSWRGTKMKLAQEKTALIVNSTLTLEGIPPEAFAYRLGNRSALEWVIDQYQVSTDKRSGIVSDPNRADEPDYIVRLVGRVITVSLETVKLVAALPGLAVGEDKPK